MILHFASSPKPWSELRKGNINDLNYIFHDVFEQQLAAIDVDISDYREEKKINFFKLLKKRLRKRMSDLDMPSRKEKRELKYFKSRTETILDYINVSHSRNIFPDRLEIDEPLSVDNIKAVFDGERFRPILSLDDFLAD